jgi:hypothetical protein
MRDAELVEVVKVSQTEDERRHEDGAGEAGSGAEEKRNTSRAEETFFSDGTLQKQLAHGLRSDIIKEVAQKEKTVGMDR